jgi:hypothetical protein
MGFISFLTEQFYILFSMYYYEVFLYKNQIQIGRFIQSVSFHADYLVDFGRKIAFPILKGKDSENVYFIKGHKLIAHYKIDHAIPLKMVEYQEITELNSGIVKIKTVKKLVGSITKETKEKALPMKLINEYNLPPHLIFEMFNAGFVTKTNAKPKTTDWTLIIIAIVAVVLILGFMAIMVFGVLKSP